MRWRNFWKKQAPASVPDMRPSFLLPHNGAEIRIATLDNFGDQFELLQDKIIATEQWIGKPYRSGYILYHLEDTVVTEETAALIIESLVRSSGYIRKIAFVGVSKRASNLLGSYSKALELHKRFACFSSMHESKNCLTSE